jgi:hypothetical protein
MMQATGPVAMLPSLLRGATVSVARDCRLYRCARARSRELGAPCLLCREAKCRRAAVGVIRRIRRISPIRRVGLIGSERAHAPWDGAPRVRVSAHQHHGALAQGRVAQGD